MVRVQHRRLAVPNPTFLSTTHNNLVHEEARGYGAGERVASYPHAMTRSCEPTSHVLHQSWENNMKPKHGLLNSHKHSAHASARVDRIHAVFIPLSRKNKHDGEQPAYRAEEFSFGLKISWAAYPLGKTIEPAPNNFFVRSTHAEDPPLPCTNHYFALTPEIIHRKHTQPKFKNEYSASFSPQLIGLPAKASAIRIMFASSKCCTR